MPLLQAALHLLHLAPPIDTLIGCMTLINPKKSRKRLKDMMKSFAKETDDWLEMSKRLKSSRKLSQSCAFVAARLMIVLLFPLMILGCEKSLGNLELTKVACPDLDYRDRKEFKRWPKKIDPDKNGLQGKEVKSSIDERDVHVYRKNMAGRRIIADYDACRGKNK